MPSKHTLAIALALAALIGAGGVIAGLNSYMTKPGEALSSPTAWPADAPPRGAPWTLVVAAHPACPCSRATAAELVSLLENEQSHVEVFVLTKSGEPGVLAPLAKLPIARTVADPDSKIATAFGARTSGHVVLFDADGEAVFSGGVTKARGMQGTSRGTETIASLLQGQRVTTLAIPTVTPVFGCPLTAASN